MSDEPQPGMLKQLWKMLPGMARHIRERERKKSGKRIITPYPEHNGKLPEVCIVCGAAFHRIVEEGKEPSLFAPAICASCQKNLDQGYIAFTSDKKYAFGKSDALSDYAGKVLTIHPAVMEKMAERFKVQDKKETPPTDEQPPNAA